MPRPASISPSCPHGMDCPSPKRPAAWRSNTATQSSSNTVSAGSAAQPKSCRTMPADLPARRIRSTANRPTPTKAISAIVSLLFARKFRQGAGLGFGAGFVLGCGFVDLGDPCLLMG